MNSTVLDPRIHLAIKAKDLFGLRMLLDHAVPFSGRIAPEASTGVAMPALALAADMDWTEGIRALADAGAPLEERDPDMGMTPLLIAAATGKVKAIEALLALGADRHAATALGWTAIYFAAMNNHHRALKALASHGPWEFDPIYSAGDDPFCARGCRSTRETLEALLESGADPRLSNAMGVSAASLAKEQTIAASSSLILEWAKMLDEQDELDAHVTSREKPAAAPRNRSKPPL